MNHRTQTIKHWLSILLELESAFNQLKPKQLILQYYYSHRICKSSLVSDNKATLKLKRQHSRITLTAYITS